VAPDCAALLARDGATADLTTNLESALLDYFVSVPNQDFRLTPNARDAIDRGTAVPDSGVDLDGVPHDADTPDLGVDEYTP
jgi:hypothetical protein